ncbi:MAG: hypothetical protein MUE97_04820 [Phycisphaerales bacterium]|jgi:hypothetical protein|nr:hypothetical protein [Phycisphaerales bacterium]
MQAVVSPYHLTSRESAAMAALLLAESVVTLLPTPPVKGEAGEPNAAGGETREAVAAALAACPRYGRVLRSWLELGPLFEAGVVRTLANRQDAMDDIRRAAERIDRQRELEALRSFVHDETLGGSMDALDALCADLLKGGPDPGIALPIVAGLDALALRHGLVSVRAGGGGSGGGGGGGSLTQQVESRLGRTVASFGVPIIAAGSGRTIMNLREGMSRELARLRGAMDDAWGSGANGAALGASVRSAAAEVTKAFRQQAPSVVRRDDDLGRRVTEVFVSIQLRVLPADAAYRAAILAMGRAMPTPLPIETHGGAGASSDLRVMVVTGTAISVA